MIGERLGPWRVLCRIGRGGMGEVFQVEEAEAPPAGPARRLAVKVLHGSYADDEGALARFARESALLLELDHPGIVRALSPLAIDRGRAFYAMEFVSGRDLGRLLRDEGPLPPRAAVEVALEVLDALAFAHRRGVLHRDVKPSNILVDGAGRARLADFGLARVAGLSSFTRSGAVLGTPEYLSPEQADGREPDARSDLYAVGAVLFQALSGRPPFRAEQPLAVLRMHVERPVPPLEAPGPLPRGLEAAVRRALEKRPEDRFPTAEAFAEALRAVPFDAPRPATDAPAGDRETGPIGVRPPSDGTGPGLDGVKKGSLRPGAAAGSPRRRVAVAGLLGIAGVALAIALASRLPWGTDPSRVRVTLTDGRALSGRLDGIDVPDRTLRFTEDGGAARSLAFDDVREYERAK